MVDEMRAIKLQQIHIAAPCPADWAKMTGDDRVRFCGECKLHVYNLSEMSRKEAEQLITETEAKICVRLYRRQDGTVITEDCPVGLRKIRNSLRKVAGFLSLICSFVMGYLPVQAQQANKGPECKSSDKKVAPNKHILIEGGRPVVTDFHEAPDLPVTMKLPPAKSDSGDEVEKFKYTVNQVVRNRFHEITNRPGPLLAIMIYPDGKLDWVKIAKSCGNIAIDDQAVECVRKSTLPRVPTGTTTAVFVDLSQLP